MNFVPAMMDFDESEVPELIVVWTLIDFEIRFSPVIPAYFSFQCLDFFAVDSCWSIHGETIDFLACSGNPIGQE